MSLKLHTVICSLRPGRIGPSIATWFHGIAQGNGKFDAALIDLKDFNLPLFDEPAHPRLRTYTHDHTKRWSESVDSADAFVFVTPEYDHVPPAYFTNAVQYLSQEWAYKPAAFVSYGGPAGGARGVQVAKQMLVGLKVMPMFEGVLLTLVTNQMKDGVFTANEGQVTAANVALNELHKWAVALKTMRVK